MFENVDVRRAYGETEHFAFARSPDFDLYDYEGEVVYGAYTKDDCHLGKITYMTKIICRVVDANGVEFYIYIDNNATQECSSCDGGTKASCQIIYSRSLSSLQLLTGFKL